MRKPIMAGNWKMNKTRDEALQFIYAVSENLPSIDKLDSIICAPAIVLRDLVNRQGDNLRIGAQNMNENDKGAYTGEISPAMLTSTNVTYVILGHSERRQYYNETDQKGCHVTYVEEPKQCLLYSCIVLRTDFHLSIIVIITGFNKFMFGNIQYATDIRYHCNIGIGNTSFPFAYSTFGHKQ